MVKEICDLLVENSEEVKKATGFWGYDMMNKAAALSATLKGEVVDSENLKEKIEMIKKNTSAFSYFRGITQTILAMECSINNYEKDDLLNILEIYKSLKSEGASSSEYLVTCALNIYKNRYKFEISSMVRKTRETYKVMRKNHPFLTGAEDYIMASIISFKAINIDDATVEIEKCYRYLKERFMASDELQTLSHIMYFVPGEAKEKCYGTINLYDMFKNEKIRVRYVKTLLPILDLVCEDKGRLIEEIKNTDEYLKQCKGFGNLSLGKDLRCLFAASIILSENSKEYIDEISGISESIITNIIIAMQIALMTAVIASSAAAANSSS